MAESLGAIQLSRLTAEAYPRIIRDMMLASDPVFSMLFNDGDGVTPDAEFSREFYKTLLFRTGEGGAYEFDDIYGNNMLSESSPAAGREDDFMVYGENFPRLYPGSNEISSPAVCRMRVQLAKAKGAIEMPADILEAVENGSFVSPDIVVKTLKSAAEKVVRKKATTLWKERDDTSNVDWVVAFKTHASDAYVITKNGVTKAGSYSQLFVGENGDSAPNTLPYGTTADGAAGHGAINRIANGNSYDIGTISGGTFTRINAADQAVWVSNMDPLGDGFMLKIKTGSNITLATGTVYYLVPRTSVPSGNAGMGGTKSTGAHGWKNWIKATGTMGGFRDPNNAWAITGGISLLSWPMLRSYVPSSGLSGASMDALYMVKLYCKCLVSGIMRLTHLIGRPEVFASTWDSLDAGTVGTGADAGNPKIGNFRYNARYDEIQRINQGVKTEGGQFVYESLSPRFVHSPYAWRKTVLGIDNTDKNWRMWVPNYDLPGGIKSPYFNKGIKFTASQMVGVKGIWKVRPSQGATTGADTDMMYAPFNDCYQFGPEHSPVSILVNNVAELTLPANTTLA